MRHMDEALGWSVRMGNWDVALGWSIGLGIEMGYWDGTLRWGIGLGHWFRLDGDAACGSGMEMWLG